MLPFDYLINQKQWINKKNNFKRNNSSHSCRTFSTLAIFCRSWRSCAHVQSVQSKEKSTFILLDFYRWKRLFKPQPVWPITYTFHIDHSKPHRKFYNDLGASRYRFFNSDILTSGPLFIFGGTIYELKNSKRIDYSSFIHRIYIFVNKDALFTHSKSDIKWILVIINVNIDNHFCK